MRVFCVLVPGAAARLLAVRAVSFARRVVSKPALRAARSASAPRAAACRPRSLCSLACLRVGARGRRPARSPSAPRASLGASSRSPRCELPACRPPRCELPVRCVARCLRGLCSLACLRVGAWGRRPARSPSAPRASLGASSRSPARPCRRPQAPEPTQVSGFSPCPLLGQIVRRGEPATEQDTPTRHGLVTGSDAPRAVFAVSA